MNRSLSLFITSLFSVSLSAQYSIDLSKIQYPSIEYLKMGNPGPAGQEIKVNNLFLTKGGVPQLPVMGEFHYVRMDERYWKDALLKMKASGVNIVSTYILWSVHEETEGNQVWSGNRDLRKFVELCQETGLLVHLRIGPYCNAEIVDGGLPEWIVKNKNFSERSNDPLYLEYVRKWYKSIYDQVKGLLYKDGGPIWAIQLENEYVTKGMVISHLMNLKRIAVSCGFDMPLYTMTHWMQSDYPKGEIVPYAGFYIERPWIVNGKNENPPTAFEFFTYNRLADDIGTNKIKSQGDIEMLDYSNNESPFFTCEVGVGTTNFYARRAVVPEEMAGANITLRLGCGVNLMGYYMYVGGTNPVGKLNVFGEEPEFSYDYQAPIREFGTLGEVMKETKKLNYFMNDFGKELATQVAYLPKGNNDYDNLQWAVRTDGNSGYLFCSNYLYKHDRPEFKEVQFSVKLKDETIVLPKNKVSIKNGSYFIWPFNLTLDKCILKYATTQPVCKQMQGNVLNYFFFADDAVKAEYLLLKDNIKDIKVYNAKCRSVGKKYYIDDLDEGERSVIDILQNDGNRVRIITLSEADSDNIWHLRNEKKKIDVVALTKSAVTFDNDSIYLTDTLNQQTIQIFDNQKGQFVTSRFDSSGQKPSFSCQARGPMAEADFICTPDDSLIQKTFKYQSLSGIKSAVLRYKADKPVTCFINGKQIKTENLDSYVKADVATCCSNGNNLVQFISSTKNNIVVAEIEIIQKNGMRLLWKTDNTWTGSDQSVPVKVLSGIKPVKYDRKERLVEYEIKVSDWDQIKEESRLYIDFVGDVASVFIGDLQVNDYYFNGDKWILGVSRYKELLRKDPMIIKIKGFETGEENIYLERNIDRSKCVNPQITDIKLKRDYTSSISIFDLNN